MPGNITGRFFPEISSLTNLEEGGSMDFNELAKNRYSVRSYRPDPVEDERLLQVLEAACMAPTASNRQPFRLIVMHTAGREEELTRIYGSPWFVQAPIIICACGLPAEAWVSRDGKNLCDVDVAIAMDHLILAAADLGLGTCWIAAFNPAEAKKILGLSDDVDPIAFTPLGYPADQPRPKKRKSVSELVKYERW